MLARFRPTVTPTSRAPRLRFDRHELAGAFGDIGTDLPLLVALVVTCGLDAASVCIVFGALQVVTGLVYGIPMPVQPLKVMAAIMLTERLSPGTLAGGGLVIGATMLLLAATGVLGWMARLVPKEVIRGIQLGLGMSLATLALRQYAGADGGSGYILALVAVALLLALRQQQRIPGPLVVMGLGLVYALVVKLPGASVLEWVGFELPTFRVPTRDELVQGALLLALPQIPLSVTNSIIATSQTTRDLFPGRSVSVRKLGLTYGVMNLIGPWFGGVPVCHGCGGLAGFHGFGARTGGAPILYGAMYLILGLVFAPGFAELVHVFPMPVLGVVLLFEGVALMMLVRDIAADRSALWVAFAVAAAAVGLPYGYAVGFVVGTLLSLALRQGWIQTPGVERSDAPVVVD